MLRGRRLPPQLRNMSDSEDSNFSEEEDSERSSEAEEAEVSQCLGFEGRRCAGDGDGDAERLGVPVSSREAGERASPSAPRDRIWEVGARQGHSLQWLLKTMYPICFVLFKV